ncbi:hypothetical protein E2C01_013001 [Portunus trituberculatus]|uniref:Uncharacterized protein n=1 Tax=Portunus trituberculatus TaxID=210409 RepID=A0A5B7DF62_PORTR|nr:hypothetical protein [Portunus trituberculatus]
MAVLLSLPFQPNLESKRRRRQEWTSGVQRQRVPRSLRQSAPGSPSCSDSQGRAGLLGLLPNCSPQTAHLAGDVFEAKC